MPSKIILKDETEPFLKGPTKGSLQRRTNTNCLITHCYRSGVARLERSPDWKDPPAALSDLLVIRNGSLYADVVPMH